MAGEKFGRAPFARFRVLLLAFAVAAGLLPRAMAVTPTGAQFTAVSSWTLSVAWTLDTPGTETPYLALSTAADFSVMVASNTGELGQGTTSYYNLWPNTTHYFKVKVSTDPDVGYTSSVSTPTLIETLTSVYIDEVTTYSVTASAYAAVLTGLERGISGVNVTTGTLYGVWGSTGNYWTVKMAMTTARSGLAAAAINGKLYAVGGFSSVYLNTNEEYDPAANAWVSKAAMPTPRSYLAAAAIGGRLYAVGGLGVGDTILNVNEEYDPSANTWTVKAAMPTARQSLAAAAINDRLYAVGGLGVSDTILNANEEYDPASNSWAPKTAMTTARYNLAAGVVNGKLYAVGGDGASANEEYSPASNTWAGKTSMPAVRSRLCAASVGGKLYAAGGNGSAANEEYDPVSNAWTAKASLSAARGYLAAALISGKLYVVGGSGPSGANEEYTPGPARKLAGLTPNTLYTFKAKARNLAGVETVETVTVSTYTLAVATLPVSASLFTNIYFTSGTVNWSSGTAAGGFNGAGARYEVQTATASSFTGTVSSSFTYSLQLTTAGLTSDTSYYFRIRSYNAGGMTDYSWYILGSTMTQDNIPPSDISDLSAAPYTNTSQSRLTWTEPSSATLYAIRYSSTLPYVADSFETGLGNWENGGDLPWIVDATTHSGTGAQSVRAGGITNLQTSWLKRRVEGPFTLTFDWRVDSEPSSDILQFLVDGAQVDQISGNTGWQYKNYSVASGSHTIEWRYTKDWATPVGSDTGWVDNIVYREFWDLATVWNAARAVGGPAGFPESETVTGLLPNIQYYFGIKAKDGLSNWSNMSNMISTYTFAAKPDSPAGAVFTPVYATSATVTWSSGSVLNGGWNPVGTLYHLELSTSSPDYYPVAASSQTSNLNATVETLLPNTTYFARVRAINSGGSATAFAVLGSTLTLAGVPGFPSGAVFTPVYASSMTVSFSSGTSAGGFNPSGTLFDAQLSTSPDYIPLFVTSKTYNLNATLTGLSPNTSYYARARAMNFIGDWSGYITLGSTMTMASIPDLPPADPVYKPVNITSMTVYWSSGSAVNGGYNPSGTLFLTEVSVSSTDFTPLAGSTQTTNVYSAFTGLAPDTTYYSRARAQNGLGVKSDYKFLGSTSTLAIQPGLTAGTTFTTVLAATVAVNWSSGSAANGGWNPADTLYTLELSSYSNFTPVAASSQTVGLTALIGGLSPDTSYYAQVRAVNRVGIYTYYTALGSTMTPAVIPASPAGDAFAPVYATSATVSWSSGSVAGGGFNPTSTLYRVELSTSSSTYWQVFSSQTYNLSATLTGLAPNTTYYGRVQALGRNGYTGFMVLGSTLTAAAVPGQPAGDLFLPIYSSSMTVNWSSGTSAGGYNPSGTRYYLELSTSSPDYAPAKSSQTYNLSAELTALTANTTYYARVRALNSASRTTLFTVLGSTETLAIPPASSLTTSTFTLVNISSFTINWSSGSVANGGWNSAGTLYNAQLSTSADFSPVAGSSQTVVLNAGFEALAANTTYYARVQALNGVGGGTGFLQLGSTATLAATPASVSFSAVYTSSLTVSWSSGTSVFNSAATIYEVEASTSGDFIPAAGSAGVSGTSVTIAGLAPNTVYYAHVRAVNFAGSTTPYAAPFLPALTNAARPGLPAGELFAPVYIASMTVNWSSGSAVNGGYNPAGTLYRAEISTSPDYIPVLDSSDTYNLSAEFLSLSTNSVYYARVKAFNDIMTGTDYTALGWTYTLAVKPGAAVPVYDSVFASSMTVNWSSGPAGGYNPAGTLFSLELATSTLFSPVAQSSRTYALSALLTDVTPNTIYYSRVQALSGSGAGSDFAILSGSTRTLAAAPALPPGEAFTPIYATSMTVNWSSGTPAGAYNPAGTFYRVEISSRTDFTPLMDSAQTSALSAMMGGLEPNSTYYSRVRAQNSANVPTEFAALGSTLTMAVTPDLPAGAVYQPVFFTSMTVNWSSGSAVNGGYNPAGTLYNIDLSSSPDFIPTTVAQTTALSAEFPALSPNTTYYARASAVNNIGAFSAYLAFPAGATSPNTPGNYGSPVANLAGDGFQLRWTANGNPAGTKYAAQYSTAANFTGSGDGLSVVTSTYSDLTGLTGNTTYYARAYVAGHNGVSSGFNEAVSTRTFPRPPAAVSFGALTSSGAVVNWSTGSNNAAGLSYLAQVSLTDIFTDIAASSSTAGVSASFGLDGEGSALAPNTTYYFRVRALGYSGAGLFGDPGSTATLANLPLQLAAVGVTSASVSLDWLPNGNPEPGTEYEVWRATEAQFLVPVLSTSSATSFLISGLGAGSTHYFRVRARNLSGVFSEFSLDCSTRTRPVPPSEVTLSAAALGVSSISWSWNNAAAEEVYRVLNAANNVAVSSGLAGDTLSWAETGLSPNYAYSRRVSAANSSGVYVSTAVTRYTVAAAPTLSEFTRVWQSSAVAQWAGNSNSSATLYDVRYWAAGGSTTTLSVYVTSAVLTGLSQGTIVSLMVRAVNGESAATAYTSVISTFIPPTEGIVTPGGEYTITYNQVTLDIGKATFGETVTVLIQAPSSAAPPDNGGLTSLAPPIIVDISALSGSLQLLQPRKNITITMDYSAAPLGGVSENALVIAYYNTARGLWVPLFSGRNAQTKKIIAKTDHFSLFQLMQAAAPSGIAGVTVGPNPLRPVRNPGGEFVFRNLPAGAGVKIYTYLGELLYETTADASGLAAWNGKNKAGRLAASDVYLALVQWSGKTKTFKLVVEK